MVKLLKDDSLGYGFVPKEFIPPGKDEYWQRFEQNPSHDFRSLTSNEINLLEKNGNRAGNWNEVLVRGGFNPDLVLNCRFWGLVRIGYQENKILQFHDLKLPCGLYDSTFISCDLGDRVAIHNVRYLSHYIIGSHSILFNIDEMAVTNHSKFGNGVLKDGEDDSIRISIEVANENGNRDILPFETIQSGDAWLWSKFRDRPILQDSFKNWTDAEVSSKRGVYGTVGSGSTIKSCRIIKDVKIGPATYIKGANKLKNLTIAGTEDQPVQIGEGVELVNGIIQKGARVFYGVKAIRFILGEESQLKYGARLINSFLGANSTISCCEVLNALIFPFHEQHHNNSFLIAAVFKGQSNMAAGATVGSNHNSRGADGEIVAERGFWPALNVSLKHNSRFAPYTLISKGSYPSELNIELPFSLVSHEESDGRLMIMPGYWFFYNMYAMARNSWKFKNRDKRNTKSPLLEYDYLAPDTAEVILKGRKLLETWCGRENLKKSSWNPREIILKKHNMERGHRPIKLVGPKRAWHLYGELIEHYFVLNLLTEGKHCSTYDDLSLLLKGSFCSSWYNTGGLMVSQPQLDELEAHVAAGTISGWKDLHKRYDKWGTLYPTEKFRHSAACYLSLTGQEEISHEGLQTLIHRTLKRSETFLERIKKSRSKDFTDPFRSMVYDNSAEMASVLGEPVEDKFILAMEEKLLTLFIGAEKFLKTIGSQSQSLHLR